MSAMTQNQKAVYEVESYLEEKYEFRKNILSGKTEVKENPCEVWYSMTEERLNSIVRRASEEINLRARRLRSTSCQML